MKVACPACDHPLDVGRDLAVRDTSELFETITGIDCPNCGFVPLTSLPDISDESIGQDGPDPGNTISFYTQLAGSQDGTIGHFRLVRLLGQGGFGSVWLADDINLNRQVALKLPNARNKDLSNLLHEAQAAAHLRHPGIVSIYEVGTEQGQVFIACEFIDGLTLKDYLTTGKPSITRTVEIMISVAEALHNAHVNEIVHRDIKPANILLNHQGQPFVTDFGLAKRLSTTQSTETTISSEGQIMGTARYMSPEQASGKTKETDHRADIYAIGVILFEMLTGHVPFRGNMRAVLQQKIFDDPPSPRSLDPAIPKDLETICLKCLERDQDKRFATAGRIAEELQRFRDGEPILARPISRLERGWRWCKRRPLISGLVLGLFASLLTGLAGVTFYLNLAQQNARLLRESLYRAQMTMASDYVERGDIGSLKQTLEHAWDPASGTDLRGFEWYYYNGLAAPFRMAFHQGDHVEDVAISSDGQRVAAAGANVVVNVWSTTDGKLLCRLKPPKGRFTRLAFSPLNGQLATACSDGHVYFWNPMQPDNWIHKVKHGPPIAFIGFTPDGRTLLTAGVNGAARLWDTSNDSLIAAIPTGQAENKAITFSPDGTLLIVATIDGRIRIRNTRSQETLGTLEDVIDVEQVAVSDDNSRMMTASYRGQMRIFSLEDFTERDVTETAFGLVGDLVFLKNSHIAALVGTSGELLLYDTDRSVVVRSMSSHFLTQGVIDRTADGRSLVIGSGDGSVRLVDTAGLMTPTIFWHDSHLRGVEFLDATTLVSATGEGDLLLWDSDSGQSRVLLEAPSAKITHMTAHAGESLMAYATTAPAVTLLRVSTGDEAAPPQQVVPPLEVPGATLVDLKFSPTGKRLAIAESAGGVRLLDTATGEATLHETTQDHPITGLAFDTADTLIIIHGTGLVSFLEVATGTLSRLADTLNSSPQCVIDCPASGTIAIGTATGEIALIDAATRKVRTTINAHTARINVLEVLPDGRTIVSGGRDRGLRMWDTVSGERVTNLNWHDRQVFTIAASPDGQSLASGDLTGAVHLWRAPR